MQGGGENHGRVRVINSTEEFDEALVLAAVGHRLVVVDYFATWCGPCKFIAPLFAQLSEKYPDVDFLKVDVDKQKEVAARAGISAMPTFHFIKTGTTVEELRGANAARLEELIQKHRSSSAGGESAEGSSSSADETLTFPPGHGDITEYVDRSQATCLNASEEHPWQHILTKEETYLESDCDEQLLVYLPFKQPLKIHSLNFVAPTDGRAPQTVKLYVNQPTMDFQSPDSIPATQELHLGAEDITESSLIPLKFVKFQNVTSLTLFVEDNQGQEPTSVIQRLRIIGKTVQATNMNEFKRVAGEKGEVHG
ncbi:Thioredoxin-like protein 1 [Balamuthia mandrillaris]